MNNKHIRLIFSSLLLCSTSTFALSTDAEQPITIDSESQSLDLKTNVATFIGNVFLKQGSIRLNAEKVIVKQNKSKEVSEIIDAFGNVATFEQTMDDGKKIKGQAKKLRYDTNKGFLTMSEDAILIQDGGNKIEGKLITYDIGKQLLVAESGSNKRVTTILQPQSQ